MRPVLALAALAVVLMTVLAACSDDDPLRLSAGDQARLSFRPQLNSFGAAAMLPINLIRLTVETHPGGDPVMDPVEEEVQPTDPSWSVPLEIPLIGGQPIDVLIIVELINVTDGVRTVEWSGQVGPLSLEPGQPPSASEVGVFRGSRENLSITDVAVVGRDTLIEGDSVVLHASATGATGIPAFFWSSLDPTVAALDTAAADSALVLSLLPGVARIVVEAGPRADTLALTVLPRITAIDVTPAVDTLDALGGQTLFEAAALDARGDPVPDVVFEWHSSDTLVARSLGGGAFEAVGPGSVAIEVTTASAEGVTGAAGLTVRQVADSVAVEPQTGTVGVDETLALSVVAFDASGAEIPDVEPVWSSSDEGVATVDAAGLVTGVAVGEAMIHATVGAASDSALVTVLVAGPTTNVWLGGAAGAETAWDAPANWSAGRVPEPTDSVLIPAGAPAYPILDDTEPEIMRLEVEAGALLTLGHVNVTVHGDALAYGPIVSDTGGSVMVDADAAVGGTFPILLLYGNATAIAPLETAGRLDVATGAFQPSGHAVSVGGDLYVNGGSIVLASASDAVVVHGSTTFVDGSTEGELSAGVMALLGDFTVSGNCSAFVSTGTEVMLADSGTVSIDCPAWDGNRFATLRMLDTGTDAVVRFETDAFAEYLAVEPGVAPMTVEGQGGATVHARSMALTDPTLDGLHLHVDALDAADSLTVDNVTFTGFAGASGPQLTISHPGAAQPFLVDAVFDATSPQPFVSALDSDAAEPFLEIHVTEPDPDGPTRTTTADGAVVWWSGQPYVAVAIAGDGQSGIEGAPLPDSLVVRVLDVFDSPLGGVTVAWAVDDGGGSVDPTSVASDADGRAATAWTLGAAFTPQTASATVAGIAPVEFTASATADAPGATIAWTGAAGSDWHDAGNWSTGATPSPADTVYVPAAALAQPELAAPDSIAGIIVEDGASLTITATTLTVESLVEAGNTIGGSGTLRVRNAYVHGTMPSLEVADTAYIWDRSTVVGDLTVLPGAFLEVIYPLDVTGSATVAGDLADLHVFDTLSVAGALTIGGAESAAHANLRMRNDAPLLVGDSLHVTGRGRLQMLESSNLIRIAGNARFDSAEPAEGFQLGGTIEVGGDWHAEAAAFHTPEVVVVFNGTGGQQSVTHLDVGHGPGEGHFGPIHVSNPDGVVFLTPTLLRGDLTSDAGVPIVGDAIVVEGDVFASGDFTAAALTALEISVTGAFQVDSTTYSNPFEDDLVLVNASLPYGTLLIAVDSAAFDGPAAITSALHVEGVLTLAGRTTVGGEVLVENQGELRLAGHTLDVSGGGMSVGYESGLGLLVMTEPTDSVIVDQINFAGSSTVGSLTDGVLLTSALEANGLAFHASDAHVVVMHALSGGGPNRVVMATPSLDDGVGARFATLRIDSTLATGVEVESDVAAQYFVTDSTSGVRLVPGSGGGGTVTADSVRVHGATLEGVPLHVLGGDGALEVDNVTFDGFDDGAHQLTIEHDATQPFVFTGMRFDSLDTGATGLYVRAVRTGLIDDVLDLEIHALNVENGADFTDQGPGTEVTWPNDALPGPPAPATIGWIGAVSSDWTDGANWNTGLAPAGADIVWVPVDAPIAPTVVLDSVSGVIVEDGATLTIGDSLVVTGSVIAGATILGPGVLHVIGTGTEVISGSVPDLIAENIVLGDAGVAALTVNGDLTLRGSASEVAEPVHVLEDLMIDEGTLQVRAALVVDGALDAIGTLALPAVLRLEDAAASVAVSDSFFVGAFGQLVVHDPAAVLDVGGSARFDSQVPSDGQLTAGTLHVAGDWYSDGDAWSSTGTRVVFDGTAGQQTITTQNMGDAPGDGRFADVDVLNTAGADFPNSPLFHGDLTSVAGAPITAGSLYIRGELLAGGNVVSPYIELKGLDVAGVYNAATTAYVSEPGDPLLVIDSAVTYQQLVVWADSAAFEGPTTISNFLQLGNTAQSVARLRLAGAVTVANGMSLAAPDGEVSVLMLNGSRLDVGADVTVGDAVVHMLSAADTLAIAGDATFNGSAASDGAFLDGALLVGGDLVGDGQAFHLTGTNLVLNGDDDQTLTLTDPGPANAQAALDSLVVAKPAGSVLLGSDLHLNGSLLADAAVLDATQTRSVRAIGDVRALDGIQVDTLELGGVLLSAAGVVDAPTVVFAGAAQSIPTGPAYPYANVVVSGSATWADADSISGDLTVLAGASLVLGGATEVNGNTIVDGTLDLGSPLYVVGDFATQGSGVVVMTDPSDSLTVVGDATFAGGSTDGLLTDGVVITETASNFMALNDAFRSTGTALVVRGDTIRMTNSGPAPGQGQLSNLAIGVPQIHVLDSLYVAGNLDDVGPPGAGMADPDGNARVTVAGDVFLDSASVALNHLVLSGAFVITEVVVLNVDTVEFNGTGQIVPIERDAPFFSIVPYDMIVISGDSVELGTDEFLGDIDTVDVIVRGAGTRAFLDSNDEGGFNSLTIRDGDASTRVVLLEHIQLRDSIHVESGVLDLNGFSLRMNEDGLAPVAFRTSGSGMLEMDQLTDQLIVPEGDIVFEGPDPEAFLTAGLIEVVGAASSFVSDGASFRSGGTGVLMRGDTIQMSNGGFGAGQGFLADLFYDSSELEVVDSLFVAGNLDDVAPFGSMLHDATNDALVVVVGDVHADSSQIIVSHLAIGGSLFLDLPSNIGIADTTTFFGTDQYVPIADVNSPSYGNVLLITGSNVDVGSVDEYLGEIDDVELIVRGPGASARLYSNDADGPLTLVMDGGAERVTLMSDIDVGDSIHIASGVLDVNGFFLRANNDELGATALRTSGTGTLEMNAVEDVLRVIEGDIVFEGGPGLLSAGSIQMGAGGSGTGTFRAVGEAFHSTGTSVTANAARIEIVDGGADPGSNAAFADLNATRTGGATTLSGVVHVKGDFREQSDGTQVIGEPGSALVVEGDLISAGATAFVLPRLTLHGAFSGVSGGGYDVDVTDLAGDGQVIEDFGYPRFDTLLVSGPGVTVKVDTMVFAGADTIATALVVNGALQFSGGPAGTAVIRDSVVVDGGSLDPGGSTLRIGNASTYVGSFLTMNGGVLVMDSSDDDVRVFGTTSFEGGSTDGLLTAGDLEIHGDFNATTGAFQATGSHRTIMSHKPFDSYLIDIADGGPAPGQNRFRHLSLWGASSTAIDLFSDVYATGNLSSSSDFPMDVQGNGFRIVSDGWELALGLTVWDLTLELDDAIDPDNAAIEVSGVDFQIYEVAVPRMVIRHPGVDGNIQFDDMLFYQGDPAETANYVEVYDIAPADGFDLRVLFTFVEQPADFFDRLHQEDPATIDTP